MRDIKQFAGNEQDREFPKLTTDFLVQWLVSLGLPGHWLSGRLFDCARAAVLLDGLLDLRRHHWDYGRLSRCGGGGSLLLLLHLKLRLRCCRRRLLFLQRLGSLCEHARLGRRRCRYRLLCGHPRRGRG